VQAGAVYTFVGKKQVSVKNFIRRSMRDPKHRSLGVALFGEKSALETPKLSGCWV
jgi:hypothetical protein